MDRATIDRMDARVNALGAALYFDPVTIGHAAAGGIEDVFVLYGGGRAGVMGDVTAEQVVAAFGFFAPGAVHGLWPAVLAAGTPSWIASVYAEGMTAAARDGWDRGACTTVARLGRRVIDGVIPLGMSLFAGWRAVPEPGDPGGDAALAVLALRELRGDIHIQSVAAAGLAPLEAEMVSRGESGARLHGWPEPYPDPSRFTDRVEAAETATSERMQRIYAEALLEPEVAELVAAVDGLVPSG